MLKVEEDGKLEGGGEIGRVGNFGRGEANEVGIWECSSKET